ncbi:MAG: adenosylcobinamide-GDP ribazoletransferase [Clostridia bacterium]|nr:adenosylcobinamide-GDP ribazoletransferase [Clostridia bacterium]
MKQIFESFCIAFSTYSVIPMPNVKWTESNRRYSLIFFPFVGVIIGIALGVFYLFYERLNLTNIIFAALATAIPVWLTGGIHIDGFCDTCDARASHKSMEQKLLILKDPGVGAFAVIKCILYFLLMFSAFAFVSEQGIYAMCFVFVISRVLSALSVIHLKCAKTSSMAAGFKHAADKKQVTAVLCIELAAVILIMCIFFRPYFEIIFCCSALVFLYYERISTKEFGGITGDLAGYFLSLCELVSLWGILLLERWILL